MMYVLDTDIAIHYMKGKEDVVAKVESVPKLFLTSVTVAELFYGAYYSDFPSTKAAQVEKFITPFSILDVNLQAASLFGKLKADQRKKGRTIGDLDILIASTCLAYGFTLITGNLRHYAGIEGLRIERI
jgi:tRNA(fMet)-specific endonuclease VapC